MISFVLFCVNFKKQTLLKNLFYDFIAKQSVSVRVCVRASHACVRKSRCEGGAKLHGFVRANVRAFRVFWVRHTRAITLEIFP